MLLRSDIEAIDRPTVFYTLHSTVSAEQTNICLKTPFSSKVYIAYDAVEAHNCIDTVAKFTDEQYTTINQSTGWSTEGLCQLLTSKQLTKTLGSKRPAVD